jgi:hypothetical protein
MRHIVEFSQTGWSVNHPVGCRGDLMKCPVTQLARAFGKSPGDGRFEAWAERGRTEWRLRLGELVPREVQGTSKLIGHCWEPQSVIGGIDFSRPR